MTKYRVSKLKLREISSVDKPAQVGAVAVLAKRHDGGPDLYNEIVNDAEEIRKGAKPRFSTVQYENALLERAMLIAQVRGITPEKALSISINNDSVLKDLAQAMQVNGGMDRFGETIAKLAAPVAPVAAAPEGTDATIRKSASAVVGGDKTSFTQAQYEDAMFRRADELAAHHRITPEKALLKGLKEDDIVKHLAHAAQMAENAAYAERARTA